jgi:hypothetical protein
MDLNFNQFTADMMNQEFLVANNITLINDCICSEDEIKEIFMKKFNITEIDFESAVKKNIEILTLLRESMLWLKTNLDKGSLKKIEETSFFQPLFKLFLQAFINDFPSVVLNVIDARKIKLECEINLKDQNDKYTKKTMRGYTDIFVSSLEQEIGYQTIDTMHEKASIINNDENGEKKTSINYVKY